MSQGFRYYNALMEPRTIKQPDRTTLEVGWSDGHTSRYDASYLRHLCPCAGCDEERRQFATLRPLAVSGQEIELANVNRVGRYALNLTFSDGHGTGIYPFDFLRTQCPCAACQPVQQSGLSPSG